MKAAHHIVKPLRRIGPDDNSIYGYRCSCGGHWKVYQEPYHIHPAKRREPEITNDEYSSSAGYGGWGQDE